MLPQSQGTSRSVPTSKTEVKIPITNNEKPQRLYTGDIVVSLKDPLDVNPVYGTVLPGPEASEINRSADGGSSTDVVVHWDTANRVAPAKGNEVGLVDRMLLRGQRLRNFEGKRGTVINYTNKGAVSIVGTNHVVENIAIDRLRPISVFVRGQEIIYNNWVGIITHIRRNVWFRLDGGITFYLETTESDGFMKNDPYWGIGVSCPGVRTQFSPYILRQAKLAGATMRFLWKWIPLLPYLYSYASAVIIKTEVTQLMVKWLYPAPYLKRTILSEPPEAALEQKDLLFVEIIGSPSTETIGFNSVRVLRLKPKDTLIDHAQWMTKFKEKYMGVQLVNHTCGVTSLQENVALSLLVNILNFHEENFKPDGKGYDVPVKVLLRQNEVEIQWDDETKETLLSIEVPFLVKTLEDEDFPSGLVVAPIYYNDFSAGERYGVIQNSEKYVALRQKVVLVRWIQVDEKQQMTDFGVHEESVYDIKPHSKYSLYVRGTIVFANIPARQRFRAGTVIDIDIQSGKMIVLNPSDNSTHYVSPHTVTPMAKRCFWNFFSRRWLEDSLIPPAHQLDIEFNPVDCAGATSETVINVLNENNNRKPTSASEDSLWDLPVFEMLCDPPEGHRFYSFNKEIYGSGFVKIFMAEREVLTNYVPEGIWIRMYENRMDLLSVLMVGPTKTPYEDGLVLFDMQLRANFPITPPRVKYISYATSDMNPAMSSDGNFCTSAVKWEPFSLPYGENESNILSFLLQIQALIFSAAPYYTNVTETEIEQNYHSPKSVAYNESVVIAVFDSTFNMLLQPWAPWERHIAAHFESSLPERLKFATSLLNMTPQGLSQEPEEIEINFPITPMSIGFRKSLSSRVHKMKSIMTAMEMDDNGIVIGVHEEQPSTSASILKENEEMKKVSNANFDDYLDVSTKVPSKDAMQNFVNEMILGVGEETSIDQTVPEFINAE